MAHIKIGRDTNGNKTATTKTDAGSFKIPVNQTSELSSAFYDFTSGDVIFFNEERGTNARNELRSFIEKNGTERQKKIISAVGG